MTASQTRVHALWADPRYALRGPSSETTSGVAFLRNGKTCGELVLGGSGQGEPFMSSVRLSAILIAALACTPLTSFAQGGGAGGGAGGAAGGGAAGGASSGGAAAGIGPAPGTTPSSNGDGTGQPATSNAKRDATTVIVTDPSSGGSAAAAARGRGVGTAPNGRPIGSSGSGPGSPEQPHDSATIQIQRR